MVVLEECYGLWRLGRPPRWTVFAIIAAIVVGAMFSALPPALIGMMIDALQQHRMGDAFRSLLYFFASSVLAGLITAGGSYAASIFRENIARNIQLSLLSRIYCSRFDAASRLSHGEVSNRLTGDVRSLCTQLEFVLFPTLSSIVSICAVGIAMLRISPPLALISVVGSLAIFVPLKIASPRLAALQRNLATLGDVFYGALMESTSLAALSTLRSRRASAMRHAEIAETTEEIMRQRVAQVLTGSASNIATTIAGAIGPAAAMGAGAFLSERGTITVGAIVAILIYQNRLLVPLSGLARILPTIAAVQVIAKRLLELQQLPPEVSGERPFTYGRLVFSGVRKCYGSIKALTGVDLIIDPGTHMAIVGPSGSGKSTLSSLLVRLYDPDAGTISIDGVPLSEIALDALRDLICMVPQDPFVFDDTVERNIAVGDSRVDPIRMDEALAISRFAEVARGLSSGIQTKVGQRGFRLSGGERQRLSLARAIYCRPKVLILDEALSGVDAAIEESILRDLRKSFRKQTLIVITHRPSTVSTFDRIVRVEKGRIAADGAPLLADTTLA